MEVKAQEFVLYLNDKDRKRFHQTFIPSMDLLNNQNKKLVVVQSGPPNDVEHHLHGYNLSGRKDVAESVQQVSCFGVQKTMEGMRFGEIFF